MITTKQMQQLERLAAKKGIFPAELMENAGKQVHFTIKQKYHTKNKHIIIFAGQGNNGGDGFATAKHFSKENPTIILFFGDKEKVVHHMLRLTGKFLAQLGVLRGHAHRAGVQVALAHHDAAHRD